MKNRFTFPFLCLAFASSATTIPPPPAPDFTVTTSDGQVKKLYQDYIDQQKVVVIEAFFTTCPPCATHAPLLQNLYTSMQAEYPGKVEFILLSTLLSDTNIKVAQYKTSKGLTMPAVGKDGGSITALQPYLDGQFGPFQGTPTFIVIAPGNGAVTFDIRGQSPSQTMDLLRQKIDSFFPKTCTVENPFGAPLDAVQIEVDAPAFDTSISTQGVYDLSQINNLKNTSYTLKPSKFGAPAGITTYDLVLISKHILAITPFNCPWQLVAADVNCTGSVTTFDVVTARKVILGIVDTLPCNTWQFMPDSATLSNGKCQDFIGVTLGDVNAGPCTDSLSGGPSESRGKTQSLVFEDQEFQPGLSRKVSLFTTENLLLEGLQLSFAFDPNNLIINNLSAEKLIDFSPESYHLGSNNLNLSWLQAKGQKLEAGTAVLTFELTAPSGGRLSELLQLSESGLKSEFYASGARIYPIELHWFAGNEEFSLAPNPAQTHFTLHSMAKQTQSVHLQLIDLQGKIWLEKSLQTIDAGNSWTIELPANASGIYLIRVNGKTAGKLLVH